MLASAVIQILGVVSILPFMALVANQDLILKFTWSRAAYGALGFHSTTSALVFLGILVILALTATNALSALTLWMNLRFGARQSHELSVRLLRAYLAKPYLWHLHQSKATMSKNILVEVNAVVTNLLLPITNFVSRFVVAALLLGLLFAADPVVAGATFGLLGGAYTLVYVLTRDRLARMGEERLKADSRRFKMSNEALLGIKTAKLSHCEEFFASQFEAASLRSWGLSVRYSMVSETPRFLIETLSYGGIVLLTLYLLSTNGDVLSFLPLLSLYAVAGYRLAPALQQCFTALSQVQFNRAILDKVEEDLRFLESTGEAAGEEEVCFERSVALKGVWFSYPSSEAPVLKDIHLEIPRNSSVAFVGMTGSGKSTLLDVLLGLLPPEKGALEVDGVPITPRNARGWQKKIGYVPQDIYVSDSCVTENIAFGLPPERVDGAMVEQAARAAKLHDFIVGELPSGYDTIVRESGSRLSGGQYQRLVIARALYFNPEVLVLDEATSALDGLTESYVMEAVRDLGGSRTILIVAHRLATVRNCDRIYLLEGGRIVGAGTYDELLESNESFRAMVRVQTEDGVPCAGGRTGSGH